MYIKDLVLGKVYNIILERVKPLICENDTLLFKNTIINDIDDCTRLVVRYYPPNTMDILFYSENICIFISPLDETINISERRNISHRSISNNSYPEIVWKAFNELVKHFKIDIYAV
jgi:hypothetical protein